MKHRFQVIEYASGYAVRDTETGKEAWMSDGVDVLTTPTGRSMKPGTEYFRRAWQRSLNENESETAEAYFRGGNLEMSLHAKLGGAFDEPIDSNSRRFGSRMKTADIYCQECTTEIRTGYVRCVLCDAKLHPECQQRHEERGECGKPKQASTFVVISDDEAVERWGVFYLTADRLATDILKRADNFASRELAQSVADSQNRQAAWTRFGWRWKVKEVWL